MHEVELSWWVFFVRLMNNRSELREEYRARGGERRGQERGGVMTIRWCSTTVLLPPLLLLLPLPLLLCL